MDNFLFILKAGCDPPAGGGHGLQSKSEREPFRFPRWGKRKKRENK